MCNVDQSKEQRFNYLYNQYRGLAITIAKGIVPENDVDDAVHEAFIRLWRGMDTLEHSEREFYWLYSIVRNTCLNYIRGMKIRPLTHGNELEDNIPVECNFDQDEWWESAEKHLENAPENVREATLRKALGYNQKEICEALDIGRKEYYQLVNDGKGWVLEGMKREK